MSDTQIRQVTRLIHGRPASDGDGVRLTRIIGTPDLEDLDPFLMLDEFGSDEPSHYAGGFPDHPHRGFETMTYMLAGRMRHFDNKGNSGLLTPGSVQWMTAGRGLIHSEMPEQEDGLLWGFQLWINLPARDKMMAPRYQDIAPENIAEASCGAASRARVIAGSAFGVTGPVTGIVTDPLYVDLHLAADDSVSLAAGRGKTAFIYPYAGDIVIAGKRVARGQLAVLGDGDLVAVATSAEGPAKAILVAAHPIREPVAKYGPFVMTTPQEIRQAIEDYRRGLF